MLINYSRTKIDFLVSVLQISRQTASKYLDRLADKKLVTLQKNRKRKLLYK